VQVNQALYSSGWFQLRVLIEKLLGMAQLVEQNENVKIRAGSYGDIVSII
jgi:hypothetical protein